MDNRPIGVFDSGLGGLTAVKQLEQVLPGESLVYFGDTGRVPYGSRGKDTILRYARQDMDFLLAQNVKAVLAACGTVSSVARSVGEALSVPYIDVIGPSARAAAAATKNGKIGVIGTAATIASDSYRSALLRINHKLEVYPQACPLFVSLVESGFVSPQDEVTRLVAERYAGRRGGHLDFGLHPLPHHRPHRGRGDGPGRHLDRQRPGGCFGPGPGPKGAGFALRCGPPPPGQLLCHRYAGELPQRGGAVFGPQRGGAHPAHRYRKLSRRNARKKGTGMLKDDYDINIIDPEHHRGLHLPGGRPVYRL